MARKIKHLDAWGRSEAHKRYGGGSKGFAAPGDGQQAPQSPGEKHSPGYDNDVPLNGWLRGKDATKKPGFAKPWDKR